MIDMSWIAHGTCRVVNLIPYMSRKTKTGTKVTSSLRACTENEQPGPEETYIQQKLTIHNLEEGTCCGFGRRLLLTPHPSSSQT